MSQPKNYGAPKVPGPAIREPDPAAVEPDEDAKQARLEAFESHLAYNTIRYGLIRKWF